MTPHVLYDYLHSVVDNMTSPREGIVMIVVVEQAYVMTDELFS